MFKVLKLLFIPVTLALLMCACASNKKVYKVAQVEDFNYAQEVATARCSSALVDSLAVEEVFDVDSICIREVKKDSAQSKVVTVYGLNRKVKRNNVSSVVVDTASADSTLVVKEVSSVVKDSKDVDNSSYNVACAISVLIVILITGFYIVTKYMH